MKRRTIRARHERDEPYPWMSRAACAGEPGFTDWPLDDQVDRCAVCPVRADCALMALNTITFVNDARDVGMAWGGLRPEQLAQLVRERRKAA